VPDDPVGQARAQARPHGREDPGREGVEKLVEAAHGLRVRRDGVQAEAEGDQVQAAVAAGRAVPVDDAGDAAAFGADPAPLAAGAGVQGTAVKNS
jgi:hypothetical protein